MELRKKLIEFAEWRENAIIPDTIEELVDDFLQQTKAQDISSSAVLAVTSDSKENKKESEVALLHSDSEAYYIEDCPCEWCAEIRRGKQSNNDR